MKAVKNLGNWQVSEVEVVYRNKVDRTLIPRIDSTETAYQILKEHWDPDKIDYLEQSKALLLNNALKVLAIIDLGTGGIDSVTIHMRVLFSTALVVGATRVIIAHNHPSGNLKPSQNDERLTLSAVEAGKLIQIRVLDHLILTSDGFFSFADEGLLI